MCRLVWLASDTALSTIPQEEDAPLGVAEVAAGVTVPHLSKPHIYEIRSFTLCGCGFDFGAHPEAYSDEELADSRRSWAALVTYLRAAVADGAVELYSAWGGEEHEPLVARQPTPVDRLERRTSFTDAELLVVTA